MDAEWKNQCKAELIQEIPDHYLTFLDCKSKFLILRPAVREEDHVSWYEYEDEPAGDILGYVWAGGKCAYPSADGRLELMPLADPDIFHTGNFIYAFLDGRLVTTTNLYVPDLSYPGAYTPSQTVIVHDTAGILPCPFPLTLGDGPAVGDLTLLSDGGFLVEIRPEFDGSRPPAQIRESALVRYGPDGTRRWTVEGVDHILQMDGEHICTVTERDINGFQSLLVLDMDGTVLERISDPAILEATRERIASISINETTDSQGRLWMSTGSYFSCYTPELECISRHRLKGDVCQVCRNEAGQVCAVTFQQSKYIIRVYRFS